jgi:hypothetical protein
MPKPSKRYQAADMVIFVAVDLDSDRSGKGVA